MSDIIITPDDPDFNSSPISWGDSLPPKEARQKKIAEAGSSSLNKYQGASTAFTPFYKEGQATGVNTVYTNPMWFSPLHTPQNWQIASRRREIYQWSFVATEGDDENPCFITKYGDFSLEKIEDVYTLMNSTVVDDKELYIQNSKSQPSLIDKATKRYVEKKINTIKAMAVPLPLIVTNDHDCMVIKKKDLKCKYQGASPRKNCINGKDAPTCQRLKCQDWKIKDYKISKIKARDVEKGDYFLVPFSREVKKSIIKTKEQARFAGHLASDGCASSKSPGVRIFMHDEEIEHVLPCVESVCNDFGFSPGVKTSRQSEHLVTARTGSKEIWEFATKLVKGKSINKKFTEEVMLLDPELQMEVLGAYIQSDGSYNKTIKQIEITTISPHLANQLLIMFYRCGILAFASRQRRDGKGRYPTKNKNYYIVSVPASDVYTLAEFVPGKLGHLLSSVYTNEANSVYTDDDILENEDALKPLIKRTHNKRFFWKNYVITPVISNISSDYEGDVYDVRAPVDFTVTANGVGVHQCRFFYENEPKVAAGIDFYSQFPINGFKLTWPHGKGEKKLLKFFEREVKRLDIVNLLKQISSEYFMLGDVFAHTDISCPKCAGVPINPATGQLCDHAGGNISRIKILNPDWIEVTDTIFADEPQIVLVPDEEIHRIVSTRQPKQIYDRLPEKVKQLVLSKQPIPLSNRVVSHIKHMPVPYGVYGSSLIRRLFTTLAYKTKIMTANWIVAERLIIPIRVVKIGSDDRPATSADIAEVNQQISVAANDPNQTIVTHHNFDYEWYGACHDEETEFLTPTGWKKRSNYDGDELSEEILTYDVYTKTTKFEKPLALHEYDYDGEMVCFNSRTFDICVTPNHKMLLKKGGEWTTPRADEIKIAGERRFAGAAKISSDSCKYNSLYIKNKQFAKISSDPLPLINEDSVPTVTIGDQDIELDTFLKFAGYYLSDGSMQHKKSNYHIQISQSSKPKTTFGKSDVLKNIKETLSDLPWHVGEYSYRENELNYVISNKSLVLFMLEQFGHGASKKSIPTWIKELPCEHLEVLLLALVEGDGHNRETQNTISFSYKSASEQLVDDIQQITYKCGYSTKKRKCKISKDSFGKKQCWETSSSKGHLSNGAEPCVRARHISRKHYTGKVWCFTTSTGFFVTRRNGKITIQGNSGKILQLSQELEHVDKEMLDGLMLNQALLNGEMCLPPNHKVLTTEGWKWIHEAKKTDSICVWDDHSLSFHYEKPQEVYKYKNVNELFQIKSGDKVLFECTGKHKVVIRPTRPLRAEGGVSKHQGVAAEELVQWINRGESVYTLMRNGTYSLVTEVVSKSYNNSVYCFKTTTGFFVAKYEDTEFISGNSGYQSAQVGVEVLIRRIEAWRTTLAQWVEERIFKPIAMMKGLLDKETTEEFGERAWLYPTLKWNDLNLKDKTQWHQLLMQLHDKQVISTQTLCEELDLEYDQEVERIRYEMAQAGPQGAQLGGAGGMGGGAMGGGGGGGGISAPGGGAAPPGGDMGMGGMPGGDMGGGGMGGGAPAGGGGMGAAAGAQPMKILKKSKAKALEQQEEPVQYGQVRFTRLEQEFRKMLDNIVGGLSLNTPYFFQYKVANPQGGQPYELDFAFPKLKLCAEVDGSVWHSNPQQVQHDRERDYQLAMRGWTVLRFDDKTIENKPDAVQNVVVSYLKKAIAGGKTKKASMNMMDGEANYHTVYAGNLIDIYADDLPEPLIKLAFGEE